jgi:hypothetical protein
LPAICCNFVPDRGDFKAPLQGNPHGIAGKYDKCRAKLVGKAIVAKRLVFHLGGYDPITSHASAQRRFVRELARFEATWSVKASIDSLQEGIDQTTWRVHTRGPNWHVETDYHVIRWDDVIEKFGRRTFWRRVQLGVSAFVDFISAGAFRGYLRTSWYYAGFFLYPFVMFDTMIATALAAGIYAMVKIRSVLFAIASGLFVLAALFVGPWRWLHLNTLFDDWIFSRDYIRNGNTALERRLDGIADEMIVAARSAAADEILVVGHSLGAVLAIDLLDRALQRDPMLGATGTPVTLLSIGSSILKIGLHREAGRFRAATERVARAPGIFWGDYQSRTDIMNFYNTNPMAEMSLTTKHGPVIRFIEFSRALERGVYRRIRLRFYRLHCQFISGNDKRDFYDYFMLVCGPISAKSQTLASEGALSMIGEDGMLVGVDAEPGGEPAAVPPR